VLVDDAFVHLVGRANVTYQNRAHFYAFVAKVMRQILVDEARQRAAAKRGGGDHPVPLDNVPQPADRDSTDPLFVLALDEAARRLAEHYQELVQVFELHYCAGWDLKQTAEIIGVPYGTVKRWWKRIRGHLHDEMYWQIFIRESVEAAMTPEMRQRVEQVFDEALSIEAGRRTAFLDAACKDDPPGVRTAVDSLLAHLAKAEEAGFLQETAREATGERMKGVRACPSRQRCQKLFA
jgi:RNA polymerase sigma factor (TIGR02999 family)